MPQQRKTRTKFTDSLPSRHTRKPKHIRQEIAAEAARIIATEGQSNFHVAKKKAAERVGLSERLALPSNLEVQDALLLYLNLYGGEQYTSNLARLRAIAITSMQALGPFSPRLVGPVWDGTAGKHSRISLHIFCDTTENLVFHLLERGVAFNQEQKRIRWHDGRYRVFPVFVVEVDGASVELVVFSSLDLRQAPPSPIDGKPQHRATLAEVQYLRQVQPAGMERSLWTPGFIGPI